MPHAHDDSIARQLLAGISRRDRFSIRRRAARNIVALLATPKHQQHMDLLASLSRLLQHEDVRKAHWSAKPGVVDIFTKNQKHLGPVRAVSERGMGLKRPFIPFNFFWLE